MLELTLKIQKKILKTSKILLQFGKNFIIIDPKILRVFNIQRKLTSTNGRL